MYIYNWYEKYYLSPIMFYWGFFNTIFELPKLMHLNYAFRLNKKEYLFIITFLSFFLKCFFLDQKILFKIHYSNLFFEINIKKKQKNFLFFFTFLRLCSFFNIYDIKINKSLFFIGKKNIGFFLISTTKIFFFISDIFNFVFKYNWYNLLINQIYILFQYIFYSTKGMSLNFFIFIKFLIKNKYKQYFIKVLRLYTIL